jgi:hypothetical protein
MERCHGNRSAPELAADPRLHAQFLDRSLTTSQTEI